LFDKYGNKYAKKSVLKTISLTVLPRLGTELATAGEVVAFAYGGHNGTSRCCAYATQAHENRPGV